jgi:cytochrome c
MKLKLISLAAATFILAAVSAPVFADQALATSKNCMACHAVDKKMVGPAFNEVSKKYAGDADAVKKLASTIQKGSAPGKGNWGPVPMPANTQVNEADAVKLATWVMAQK